MMHLQNIPTKIPEPNPFFNSYLYHFEKVSPFFRWNPYQDFEGCLQTRAANFVLRDEIFQILDQQNRVWEAPQPVFRQIERLKNPNTLAVITGQQVGLFTGPLYTIYKAISAIHYCRVLEKKYPKFNFVPVFWLESNDHDYAEINHCFLPDQQDKPIKLELASASQIRQSVSYLPITADIQRLIDEVVEKLPSTEFRDGVVDKIRQIYKPGKSFVLAFARHLTSLLGGYGLILCDPSDPSLKKVARPIFRQVLERPKLVIKSVEAEATRLRECGFMPALNLPANVTGLFLENDNRERCRLDVQEEALVLNCTGQKRQISSPILHEWLENQPERFSPNVALRPIIQDWVLPTAVYIGGPGELSYLAQLNLLYEEMKICPPVFLPRARATIVEKKVTRLMQKHGMTFEDVFTGNPAKIEKLLRRNAEPEIFHQINFIESLVEEEFKKLKVSLMALDSTLQNPLNKTLNNTLKSIGQLKNKVESALNNRNKLEIEQINRVFNLLKPNNQLQERVFNVTYYEAKFGPDFIKQLFLALDCEVLEHQLLMVG